MGGLVLAAAAAAALAASPAAPTFRLELVGTAPGAEGIVHLVLRVPGAGHATVYAPAGWRLDLHRPPGAVVARGTAGGERGALSVASAPPAGATCGPPGAEARWVWSGAFPLEAEVSPTPVDSNRLAYRIDVCAAPVALDLTFVPGALANPSGVGLYTWRAVADGGAVEVQSQVPVPHALALRASATRGRLTVRGRLRIEGLPEQGARVVVFGGTTRGHARARVLGRVRTGGGGGLTLRTRARGVRWVSGRTLPRRARCARPLAPMCSGVVAPAFAPTTRVVRP